jgi:hypothetical protein
LKLTVFRTIGGFVKYFFLSEGWAIGRIWEASGVWDEAAWRRKPDIQPMNLCIREQDENLWLYRAEDAVLMVEVKPTEQATIKPSGQTIGNVVLKRLISADQVIDLICKSQ